MILTDSTREERDPDHDSRHYYKWRNLFRTPPGCWQDHKEIRVEAIPEPYRAACLREEIFPPIDLQLKFRLGTTNYIRGGPFGVDIYGKNMPVYNLLGEVRVILSKEGYQVAGYDSNSRSWEDFNRSYKFDLDEITKALYKNCLENSETRERNKRTKLIKRGMSIFAKQAGGRYMDENGFKFELNEVIEAVHAECLDEFTNLQRKKGFSVLAGRIFQMYLDELVRPVLVPFLGRGKAMSEFISRIEGK